LFVNILGNQGREKVAQFIETDNQHAFAGAEIALDHRGGGQAGGVNGAHATGQHPVSVEVSLIVKPGLIDQLQKLVNAGFQGLFADQVVGMVRAGGQKIVQFFGGIFYRRE
jgi:hypothetical protein